WRGGGGAGLMSLLARGLMGQARLGTAPKLIEAERFVVRDASGKMRVLLGDTGTGVPALIFFDEREKTRALLGIRADSGLAQLVLADSQGAERAAVGVGRDGAPFVALLDPDGKSRAMMRIAPDGEPFLALFDAAQKRRAALLLDITGAPLVALADADERPRALLGMDTTGKARL